MSKFIYYKSKFDLYTSNLAYKSTQVWMKDAMASLHHHLQADVFAEDVPEEHQVRWERARVVCGVLRGRMFK